MMVRSHTFVCVLLLAVILSTTAGASYPKEDCPEEPPPPENCDLQCFTSSCIATCRGSSKFTYNETTLVLECIDGVWLPTDDRYGSIPNCNFLCTPNCNQGKCMEDNICKCRDGFTGERCDSALFCSSDEEFSACSDTCTVSCPTLTTNLTCAPTCTEQCQCKSGLLADMFGRCVSSDQCPCRTTDDRVVDAGYEEVQLAEDGSSVVCKCSEQQWQCNPIKRGNGGVIGTQHYLTLDGLPLRVEGECSRYLLQESSYSIIVEGVDCVSISETAVECDKRLSISIPQLKLYLNKDKKVTANGRSIRQLPYKEHGVTISEPSSMYINVELPNGLQIQWNGDTSANILAPESLYGKTRGLLGVYNGDISDDLTTPDGTVVSDVTEFGDSWKVDANCVDSKSTDQCDGNPEYEAQVHKLCDKILDPIFADCINTEAFKLICEIEGCCTGLNASCEALSDFASTQCPVDVGIFWRNTTEECAMECKGDLEFQWCGDSCTRTCRDIGMNPGCTPQCAEGCMCLPGFSMDSNGECIEQNKCPCFDSGMEYPEGEVIVRPSVDPYIYEKCECINATWKCEVMGNCSCGGWGDPHYTSFDGLPFNFYGGEEYYLIKNAKFSVATVNRKVGYVSIADRITVRVDGLKVSMEYNGTVSVGGIFVSLPYTHKSITVNKLSGYSLKATLYNGVVVKFDSSKTFSISMPSSYYQQTAGLCGRYNFDKTDDTACPKTEDVEGYCWNILGTETDPPVIKDPCEENPEIAEEAHILCDVINGPVFSRCLLPTESLYADCIIDTCGMLVNTSVCPIFTQYAADCAKEGIIINWIEFVPQCAMPCPEGQLYQVCGDSCTRSCKDIAANPTCVSECADGCNCPPGMTLDNEDKCVLLDECPCEMEGIIYSSGEVITRGDQETGFQNCTCSGAKWECMEQLPAICAGWGDPHFMTFDGRNLSFQGICSYYLIKSIDFSIEANNEECNGQACLNSLTIRTEADTIQLQRDHVVTINDVTVTLPIRETSFSIRMASSSQTILVLENGIQVKWDNVNTFYILASPSFTYHTQGLCGTYNGQPDDDFTTPDGELVETANEFGNSWKVDPLCEDFTEETHTCDLRPEQRPSAERQCGKLLGPMFSDCHESLNVTSFYEACVFDFCANEEPQVLCLALAAYAQQCAHAGTIVDWRQYVPECGVECVEGHVYKACTDACSRSCYDMSSETCSAPCVEGCNCPDGFALDDNEICVPVSQCQCRYDGNNYNNEDIIFREKQGVYQRCTCLDAKWSCEKLHDSQCLVIGDSHFSTLDGQTFTFPGDCSYYLIWSPLINVELKTGECQNEETCTRSVTINIPDLKLILGPGLMVTLNDEVVPHYPYIFMGVTVYQPSSHFLTVNLGNSMEVWWDGMAKVFVDAPAELYENTQGLCGTFNNDPSDDYVMRDGNLTSSLTEFANSWKTEDNCGDVTEFIHPCDLYPEHLQAAQEYCELLNGPYFQPCHKALPISPVYDSCLQEVCENQGHDTASCSVLSTYEKQCSQLDIYVEWRQHVSFCDGQCPAGQMYQICGDSCARTCADLQVMPTCVSKCAEGCNCPQGFSIKDGVCVSREECPCVFEGQEYVFGDEITMDEEGVIKHCTCEGGKWRCEIESPPSHMSYKFLHV